MSDSEITPPPQSEQDTAPPPQPAQDQPPPSAAKLGHTGVSFSIWPPTQRTRDAVINRLIETLSTPSVLSKRYGTMAPDEASAAARQIEEEAFAVAGGSTASDNDGIEILQVYSKEISKRMLDTVKAKSTAAPTAVDNGDAQTTASDLAHSPTAESDTAATATTESET
ncbi:MFP1 attachment factor 1 [Cajanus cajan]|uniref:MFP1 attachment factor 1 n=1 Tax=Cajanus cajan TaxID=3821 RepID=A0A151TTY3_CAJCA|nr:MFP1 attachment factor 1 [Cajanus cajan]KYP70458.1 MFP1 attachment factor 1 [Cajanus cajan]